MVSMNNVYQQIGKVNEINGNPSFRGVATLIQWDLLGVDPIATIKANIAACQNHFVPTPDDIKNEPIAIVAFGPSLHDTWREIAKFKTIFTCSGSHKFLLERDIIPTYHLDSDPRAHKTKMLGKLHGSTQYLVASISHPSYIEYLKQQDISKIRLWHIFLPENEGLAALPREEPLITGGDTIGPRTMKIARLMGYTNMHFFGFDGCVDEKGSSHASPHGNPKGRTNPLKFNGHTYQTYDQWEEQIQWMLEDLDRMPEIKWQFHGKGLWQAMAKEHIPVKRYRLPLWVMAYEETL
mgnify:FL=1